MINFEALLDPSLVENIERLSSELEYELEALVNLCEAQARRSFGEVTSETDPAQSELLLGGVSPSVGKMLMNKKEDENGSENGSHSSSDPNPRRMSRIESLIKSAEQIRISIEKVSRHNSENEDTENMRLFLCVCLK